MQVKSPDTTEDFAPAILPNVLGLVFDFWPEASQVKDPNYLEFSEQLRQAFCETINH